MYFEILIISLKSLYILGESENKNLAEKFLDFISFD